MLELGKPSPNYINELSSRIVLVHQVKGERLMEMKCAPSKMGKIALLRLASPMVVQVPRIVAYSTLVVPFTIFVYQTQEKVET